MDGYLSIASRKKRWLDLMDPAGGTRFVYAISFANDPEIPARPWPRPENLDARVDWALRKYHTMTERAEWLPDDSLPFLDLFTGTEIFAATFGCPVHLPADNMPFALPCVSNSAEAARLILPSLESTPLYDLLLTAEKTRDRAGAGALLRLPDLQSPMDVAALIWEKSSFYIAMIEEPEAVTDLAAKTGALITAFLDAWFARLGTEYIAHYPDYYMQGGMTVSEDEIGAVSPACFEELFLPELVMLSERYGGIGLHCCAHARHQWGGLARIPGLRLVNLIQPKEVLEQAYPFFADICVQMHSWPGDGPAWTWPARYPAGARVVMTPQAGSRDEALEICELLQDSCGRSVIMGT